jgi:hypothetical protein
VIDQGRCGQKSNDDGNGKGKGNNRTIFPSLLFCPFNLCDFLRCKLIPTLRACGSRIAYLSLAFWAPN